LLKLLVSERDYVGTYNVLFRHRGVILITAISEVIPVGRHAMVNAKKYSPELWSISSYQVDAQLLARNAFSKFRVNQLGVGSMTSAEQLITREPITAADVGEMSAGDLSVFGLVLLVGSAHKVEYRRTKTNRILK
jgi:hypothetical protein